MGKRWIGSTSGALFCAVLMGACGSGADEERPDAGPDPAFAAAPQTPASALPALALGYEAAAGGATERLIGQGQAALREHPREVPAYTNLAALFLRRARETSRDVYRVYARDVLTSGRLLAPDDVGLRTLSTMLLLDEHRFESAAQEASALAASRPSDPTPRLLLGDAWLELGRYDDATDAYQAAMDLRPDLRSYNRAAYMRWLFGDFEGATEIMELAIDSGSFRDPESMAWCFTDLASMYLHRGELDRAAGAAQRALALVGGYVPALVIEAKVHARRGNVDAAIGRVREALGARPVAADYLLLAELEERRGDLDAAAVAAAKAERLAVHDPRPLAHYLARRDESNARALELAEVELAQRKNIWAWDTLALARLRAGDVDGASEAIDEALQLQTRDAAMVLHRALIEQARAEPSRAKASLEEALSIDAGVDPRLVEELRARLGAA